MQRLEDVFKTTGIPTITFVPPENYAKLKVSMRTPGKCIVLEGPSGIGKTTTVSQVLTELGASGNTTILSARRVSDLAMINALPEMKDIGVVIVDDFHKLPDKTKQHIADFMKILADESDNTSKLVLIGINKAGERLIRFGHDIGLRIDVFRLETNPIEKIVELIAKGEAALNVKIDTKLDSTS